MHRLVEEKREIEILLIEDNPGDVILTKKAFQSGKIKNNIHVAKDGEVAIKMLKREGSYSNFVKPDIILLDLNIPKKDGREVLENIKQDSQLKQIPVIILTGSKAEQDIVKTYNLHANGYILKPVQLEEFIKVIQSIENFWFTIVLYPDGNRK